MRRAICATILAFSSMVGAALAGGLPDGPISIVVPFSAGGTADTSARLIAETVERNTHKTFIVNNMPGGGGIISANFVKKATPDGTVLRLADIGTDAILPNLQQVPYTPADYTPICELMSWDQFLVVPSSRPAKTAKEFVDLAKTKGNQLNFGSQGVGSGGDILGMMFEQRLGIKMTHVPYKGGAPLGIDLAAGRVDLAFTSFREMQGPMQEGRVRLLAVASPKRSPLAPDVPTLAEAGLDGVVLRAWFGLVAPKGTPRDVIDSLSAAMRTAASDEKLAAKLQTLGVQLDAGTPDEFQAFLTNEKEKYAKVVAENRH